MRSTQAGIAALAPRLIVPHRFSAGSVKVPVALALLLTAITAPPRRKPRLVAQLGRARDDALTGTGGTARARTTSTHAPAANACTSTSGRSCRCSRRGYESCEEAA